MKINAVRISARTAIQIVWSTRQAESLGGRAGRKGTRVTYIQECI